MASNINPKKIVAGDATPDEELRSLFTTIKEEIEALQADSPSTKAEIAALTPVVGEDPGDIADAVNAIIAALKA